MSINTIEKAFTILQDRILDILIYKFCPTMDLIAIISEDNSLSIYVLLYYYYLLMHYYYYYILLL